MKYFSQAQKTLFKIYFSNSRLILQFVSMPEQLIHIRMKPYRIIALFLFSVFIGPVYSIAQCTSFVNNFPYNEDFETSNGNWVTGGTSPDWAWGTPQKPVIKNAGTGLKCWITGGLNKPAYNSGENAWVKSPCFDFSNVQHPYIKFKVFWETEGKYDGANLQYSTDGGTTWLIPGSITDVSNCLNSNWYNYASLGNLGNKNAWSGNIQAPNGSCVVGGGSNGWVTAQHTMPYLAGKASVVFRFVFAAGTTCNNFDGFAFDDITIGEAPPNNASFTYNCTSSNTISFTSTSALCASSYTWDFGDPSSGAANTSSLSNPTHTYLLAGDYAITLTVAGPDNAPSTYVQANVSILSNINANVTTPITCGGTNTGAATVTFSGGGSSFSYNWNTNPVQTTATATNLGAGTYNVTVQGVNGCPATTSVVLTEPPPLSHTLITAQPTCNNADGSIAITMAGGTAPYSYSWIPNISSTSSANNLAAGNYTVTVKDKNQCSDLVSVNLVDASNINAVFSATKNVSCFGGNNGSASVTANGGSAPYTYVWAPYGGNSAQALNLTAGNYTVAVTDSKGCTLIVPAIISQPTALATKVSFQNTSCGNNDGSALVEVTGGTSPYQFVWNPGNLTGASVINLDSGQYIVTVQDLNSCTQNDTANIGSSTAVKLQLSHTDVDCFGNNTGTANVQISGGTTPYNISWANGSQTYTGDSLSNINAGTYTISVHDADICSSTGNVTILQPPPFDLLVAVQPSICNQDNGTATVTVGGATAPYTYLWLTTSATTATITNLSSGFYPLTVTDKNNCVITSGAQIESDGSLQVSLGKDTSICEGDKIILSPGVFNSYTWQDNAVTPTYTVTQAGTYSVKVTNSLGCTATDSIQIIADCGGIYFPTAFTPNGDSRNDLFGPLGNLNAISDYKFSVYNRYGQLIFQSKDPYNKWDGKVQAKTQQTATFVWFASFIYKAQSYARKGTVTIVR